MTPIKGFTQKISIITILSLSTSSVFAGSNPTNMLYDINQAHNVPSLSGTMLIVLSLLLFVVAFRISKQKSKAGAKFFISLLGIAALTIGTSGIKLASDLVAGEVGTPIPHLTAAGRVPVFVGKTRRGDNIFINGDYPAGITITGFETAPSVVCGQAAYDLQNSGTAVRPSLAARHVDFESYSGPYKTCGAVTSTRGGTPATLNGNVLNLNEACQAVCIDTNADM